MTAFKKLSFQNRALKTEITELRVINHASQGVTLPQNIPFNMKLFL